MSPFRGGVEQRMKGGGKQRGRNAFAHYICHYQQSLLLRKRQDVIKIAPNLPRAQAEARQPIAGQSRKCFRQQRLLDVPRNFKFMRGQPQIDLLLLKPRVDNLNREKFAEGVDDFDLVDREWLLNLKSPDSEGSQQRLAARDRLHEPNR